MSARRAIPALLACALCALALPAAAPAFTIPYTFTPVAGSPFSAGALSPPFQTLFSPDGSQLATLSIGWGVNVQSVSKSGALGPVSVAAGSLAECKVPKHAPLGGRAESIAYSPNGSLLAVAIENSPPETGGSLRIYSTAGKSFPSDSCRSLPNATLTFPMVVPVAYAMAFSPTGLLAVTDAVTNEVSVYVVTSAGKAYPLTGSPFHTGREPDAVAFGPTKSGGEVLAVANRADNTVSVFTVYGGAVPPAAGSPFPAGGSPTSLAISPAGLLAVANQEAGAVSMFSVNYVGTPTAVAGSPFTVGGAPDSLAFDPTGTLLAAAGGAGGVPVFSVSPAGALTQLSSSPLKPGSAPVSVDFSPDGFLLAAASGGTSSWSVYSYGDSVSMLPPWLTERLGSVLEAGGLGLEKARIMPLVGHALEELDFSGAHPAATVHLVSKSVLPGRLVAGHCVRSRQASGRDPRCVRSVSVPALTFVARDRTQTLRVLSQHRIKPGAHTLWVTATARGVSSVPQALEIDVVG
jgi:WD40 repeat protein